MKSISLCMIVKNEELSLPICLSSIKEAVDEIIIVDTGSTDHTKEIAAQFTDKIYDFKWCNDFAKARNMAFSKATKEFILWMDADDVILEDDKEKLITLKEELTDKIDGVMMKYRLGFNRDGTEKVSYYRQRLVRRAMKQKWYEPVHEYLEIVGNVITRDIAITHVKLHSSGDRNLKIYEARIKEGKPFSTRALYYYGKELYERERYTEAAVFFEKFLKRKDGWIEDYISCCFKLSDCYNQSKKPEKALRVLIKSFEYDIPRAEICCRLGEYYIDRKEYQKAVFWYTTAYRIEPPKECLGFIIHEYWNYVPLMQLCMCHDRLGEIEKAREYNELASKYRPNSPAVLANREYFNNICSK